MIDIATRNVVDLWRQGKIVCITTNGFVKKDGCGVLGRGNALAMAQALPVLPSLLGQFIKRYGHRVGFIFARSVISFPVKPVSGSFQDALPHLAKRFKETDIIPGFWCKADLDIIETSMKQLNDLVEKFKINEVWLPIPGVNNGQLKFEDVLPILERSLPQIKICKL